MTYRLLARLVTGIAVVATAFAPAPCLPSAYKVSQPVATSSARLPIRWRLGKIDSRFNLEADQVKRAAERAIHVWEAESGKRLFVYDEKAGFPINLVFDARQQARNARRDQEQELDVSKSALERADRDCRDAMDRFKRAQASVNAAIETYDSRLEAYNSRIDHWNASGGAPRDVAAILDADKANLSSERLRLRQAQQESEDLRLEANRLVDARNDLSKRYNLAVDTFNGRFGTPITEEIGECLKLGTKTRSITIHVCHDSNHLALVLAHEFGHSLGLRHVEGDDAVMSAVETGGDLASDLRLTARDKAELRRVLDK